MSVGHILSVKGGLNVADYEKMYYLLFNAVTDSLRQMEAMNFGTAAEILKQAQIRCEEIYMTEAAENQP